MAWVLVETEQSMGTGLAYEVRVEGGEVIMSDEHYYNTAPHRSYAEMIVREHNAHAALVAALEKILDRFVICDADGTMAYDLPTIADIEQAEAALKRAKGHD